MADTALTPGIATIAATLFTPTTLLDVRPSPGVAAITVTLFAPSIPFINKTQVEETNLMIAVTLKSPQTFVTIEA